MKNDEIDLLIAKFLGWKRESFGYVRPNGNICNPRFCEDLNAMNFAEIEFKESDEHGYSSYLSDLFEEFGCGAISLSAKERAERFVKYI